MISINKLNSSYLNSTTLNNILKLETVDTNIILSFINSGQIEVIGSFEESTSTPSTSDITSTMFSANISGWQMTFTVNSLIFKNIFPNIEVVFEGLVPSDNQVYTPDQNMNEIKLGNGEWKFFAGNILMLTWNGYEQFNIIPGTSEVWFSTKPSGLNLGDNWVISFDSQNMIIYNYDNVNWNEVVKL